VAIGCRHPYIGYQLSLAPKATAAGLPPHPENDCQQSLNASWSSSMGNQGIVRIYQIITELLNALVLPNPNHKRQNMDSKITNVITCKVIKKIFLDVN